MNTQSEIATPLIGNRMSAVTNEKRMGWIIQWMRSFLIAVILVLGPGLAAESGDQGGDSPANFIVAPASGAQFWIGQPVTLSMYTIDYSHRPRWIFGDGTSATASALSCAHTYIASGTYIVQLIYPAYGGHEGSPSVTYTISVTVRPRPTISAFSALPAAINRGQNTTLSWATTGVDVSCMLNQGIGVVTGTKKTVNPIVTTTYILTATNRSGSVTAPCTVTVNQPPTVGAITIPTFEAERMVSLVLPASATDPENDAITYSAFGLPDGLTFATATRTLSGMVTIDGTYSFNYVATDDKGAVTNQAVTLTVTPRQASQSEFTTSINYNYDNQGRLSALTYPSGGVVGYTYDDLDRVTKVTYAGENVVSQIAYDGWGNPIRRQFRSGAMDEWTYNPTGTRVIQWTIGTVGGTPEVRTYTYDKADRLTKAGEWDTLTYDANSRLTQAVGFGFTDTLAHDAYNNNISSVTISAGAVPSSMNNYTFGPLVTNHLPGLATNSGLTQVSETNFGEITNLGTSISSSSTLSMTWDALGRMTSTRYGTDGAVEAFQYAASGLRTVRKDSRVPGRNRLYAYTIGGNLLSIFGFESIAAPWASRDLVYLGSEAIAEIDSEGFHDYHNDHLGSPRVITSAAGIVEGTRAYGPYGETIAWSGDFSPAIGYTGHQMEPTGLIYMRGRFYSPAWHRFMNSNRGVDPNLLNHFAYTIGSPLMSTDATGMDVGSPGYDATPNKRNKYIEYDDGGKFWCGYEDAAPASRNAKGSTNLVKSATNSVKSLDPIPSAEENIARISNVSSSPEAAARDAVNKAIATGNNLAKAVGPLPGAPMIGAGRAIVAAVGVVDDPSPKNAVKAAIGIVAEGAGVSSAPESIKSTLSNGSKVIDNTDRMEKASGPSDAGDSNNESKGDDDNEQ